MTREWSYRLRDLVLVLLGLLFLWPVLLGVALAIRVVDGSPVLFRQQRPGRYGRTFGMVKFRTMRPPTEPAEPDELRISRLGAFLRATSLDELPELFNVLLGHMSLVGPRPLLPGYLDHYDGVQHLRHQVRPGLTGLAQVSGRNSTTWQERLDLDVDYVRTRGHVSDVRILARTALTVIGRRGITHPGHATMPRFDEGTGE